MNSVNLIPRYRRLAKARKARLRNWAAVVSCCAALLAIGYFSSIRSAAADTRSLDQESQKLALRLQADNKTVAALAEELFQARRKLQTAQAIGQQPDWSLLLALLARNTDENVVLDLCRLQPAPPNATVAPKPSSTEPSAAAASPLVLELDGFAKSQPDVSEYVLRLEATGLFDEVKLVKTNRQDYLSRDAVAFRLDCTFRTREGKARHEELAIQTD